MIYKLNETCLKVFNNALLGKRAWKIIYERSSMQYKTLTYRYGENVGNLNVNERHTLLWLRGIRNMDTTVIEYVEEYQVKESYKS